MSSRTCGTRLPRSIQMTLRRKLATLFVRKSMDATQVRTFQPAVITQMKDG